MVDTKKELLYEQLKQVYLLLLISSIFSEGAFRYKIVDAFLIVAAGTEWEKEGIGRKLPSPAFSCIFSGGILSLPSSEVVVKPPPVSPLSTFVMTVDSAA